MKKLSTESYKGVRDFYPADKAVQKFIFDTWRSVAESFGYEEYSASILEPSELYEAKTGQEIINEQTYTLTDRGERRVTLRPEMTPTVARMVSAKRRELPMPLRWFSIPNLFRYERPQRGRLREHWQLNVDLFGIDSPEADAEIIMMANQIMLAFGATAEDFSIRINSRVLLDTLLKKTYGLDDEKYTAMMKLLDKKNKIDDFDEQAKQLIGKPFMVEDADQVAITPLFNILKDAGVKNIVFDPTITRGFDYYTGMIFEIFDTNPQNNRSLFGGGRYNKLLEIFEDEPIPAVGFGMGDVTIKDFLEVRKLLPDYASPTKLLICTVEPQHIQQANELASTLRKDGINTVVNLTQKSTGDQISFANKKNIPYILCIGDKETQSKTYTLKKLTSGEETPILQVSDITKTINK
jgi:histidyl-tRNA synthetase